MFGSELEPKAYIVDANFLNGDTSVCAVRDNPAEAIVARCEEFGFAIVRNVLSKPDFDMVCQDSQAILADHDQQGWTQRIESLSVTKVDKTMERRTELPARSQSLIGEFVTHLSKVTRMGDRIYTQDEQIDTAYVVRQLHRSQIGKHRDPVSGVMCDLSLQGRAMMGFWQGRRKLASTVLEPNDMVVMPARTAAQPKRKQLVKHNIINVTAKDAHDGERLTLIYNYGRTRMPS
ncbi:MAG: hypothetical protein ACQR33_02365 [Candidatus Saccharibacteria bacterium]